MKGANFSELIFDMDEEVELSPSSTPSKALGVSGSPESVALSSSGVSAKRLGKQRVVSEATLELPDHDAPIKRLDFSAAIEDSPTPWHSPLPLSAPKLSMKDIMNQTSTSRPSNLSLELSGKQLPYSGKSTTSIANAKLSQKERKKQQQQAALNVLEPSPSTQPLRSPRGVTASPWKFIPKPKVKVIEQASPTQSTGKPIPQLTMRQTIANPSISNENISIHPPTKRPSPKISTDSPQTRSATPSSTIASPIPIIKSIRHIPMEPKHSHSNQNIPLNEILSQQAAEKMMAQGGGPKRSIADIQAEQEFQEWWDKESERAQAEEKVRNEPPKAKEKKRGPRPARRRPGADQKVLAKGNGSSVKQ
jgi:hypothetical protein